jgi:hypothetical protein
MGAKLFLFFMAIVYSFIGLMIYYSGEIFIALREIALNTRDKTAQNQVNYGGLELLQKFCRILGLLIFIGTWIVFIWVAGGSTSYRPF